MEAILTETASRILPDTPYEDALGILQSEMQQQGRTDNIKRRLEVQSMLVHNDPLAAAIASKLRGKTTFKECFKVVQNYDWPEPKPFQIRLGRRQYIFANRRACMIFCYHRDVVGKWCKLRGAPKNIQVPKKEWTFAPDRASPPMTMEDAIEYVRNMPPAYPPGTLWGDMMMSSDED